MDQPPRLAREGLRERRPRGRDEGLDGVRERVVARGRGHAGRLADGELGVEERHLERRARVAARHLHVRRVSARDGVGLRVAPGAGGGRDADHRQHRAADLRRSRGSRRSSRRRRAGSWRPWRSRASCRRRARRCRRRAAALATAAPAAHMSPSGFSEKSSKRVTPRRAPRGCPAPDRRSRPRTFLVAHQQHVAQAELRGERTGALHHAGAEDQAGARLPVDEGGQDGEVHAREEGCRKQSTVWSLTMPTACMNA